MNAAMNVSIGVEIFVAHGIEHAQGFLRGCSVVEIYKRTVVDSARKNWEVGAYFGYIVHDVVKLKW